MLHHLQICLLFKTFYGTEDSKVSVLGGDLVIW